MMKLSFALRGDCAPVTHFLISQLRPPGTNEVSRRAPVSSRPPEQFRGSLAIGSPGVEQELLACDRSLICTLTEEPLQGSCYGGKVQLGETTGERREE
jgi:hypothetical protein